MAADAEVDVHSEDLNLVVSFVPLGLPCGFCDYSSSTWDRMDDRTLDTGSITAFARCAAMVAATFLAWAFQKVSTHRACFANESKFSSSPSEIRYSWACVIRNTVTMSGNSAARAFYAITSGEDVSPKFGSTSESAEPVFRCGNETEFE